MTNCTSLDKGGLSAVAKALAGTLTNLDISGAETILDDTLDALLPLVNLKSLGLRGLMHITGLMRHS